MSARERLLILFGVTGLQELTSRAEDSVEAVEDTQHS